MGYTKDQLLARLKELQINYFCYEHPAVLTADAQAKYVQHLGGGLSKNLLLKDKKQRFYLVSALANTNVDLKVLSQRLGLGKGGIRMAPEEALQEILQVPLGCVTPFALINDSASTVSLLLDQGFKAQESCYFHPLTNEMTISLSVSDLNKFLVSIGRQPSYVDLEACPLVGKDNPPDLAHLVPSEVPILPDPITKLSAAPVAQNNVPKENKPTKNAVSSILGETNSRVNLPKSTKEKTQTTIDPLAEATDVEKFVTEIVERTSKTFLSEITKNLSDQQKELLRPSVSEGVKKRITSDLENLTMSLKNAAYTQGFQAGSQAMLQSGLQGTLFRK